MRWMSAASPTASGGRTSGGIVRVPGGGAAAAWACLLMLLSAAADAGQGDPREQFDKLFGADARRAKATPSPRDDAALAVRMLAAARRLKELGRLQALLCAQAFEFAVQGEGGYVTAEEAAKLLAEVAPDREDESREMLLRVYRLAYAKAARAAKLAAGRRLADQMVLVADRKIADRRWAEGESLYRQALGLATSLRLPLGVAILGKIRRAKSARQLHGRLTYLTKRLGKDASDAAARRELILLYVVDADDPAAAGKLISAGLDETLRTYVPLAAQAADDVPPPACLELARWYRALSDRASGAGKGNTLKRAKRYYERYLSAGRPNEAAKAKAEAELDRVGEELSALLAKHRPPFSMPGAVLALTFEETTFFRRDSHRFVRDLSGQDNDGLVVGCKQVEGVAGRALYFDGKDDCVALGNPRTLQLRGDQTISMWLNPERLDDRRNPFAKAYGGEGAITLEIGGRINYFYGTGGGDVPPYQAGRIAAPLAAGQWTHIAIVRDLSGGKLRMYRNGVLQAEVAAQFRRAAASRNKAYIGKGYVRNFLGRIDEVAVFARALSEADVKRLYDLGRAGKVLH